jgi:hypothetical protein
MFPVGLLALLSALLPLPLALAARAEAFVYWSDDSRGTIGRANLDGTGVERGFIGGIDSPGSVAVDGRYSYWGGHGQIHDSTGFEAAIARARLDGTKIDWTFIPAAAGMYEGIDQIAVDDDHIYWAKNFSHGGVEPFGSISRANLDGTGVESEFVTGFFGAIVTGLAVDANHIYWSQTGGVRPDSTQTPAIGRANLDGTGVERAFIPFPSGSSPGGVEVDAAHIYWFNAQATGLTIGRANLDGTGVDQSFIGGFGPQTSQVDLAVDAGYLYWAEVAATPPDFTPTGMIGRADLGGANVDHGFITPAPPTAPFGLAVNFSLGKLKKAHDRGNAKLKLEVPAPGGVALAQTKKLKGAEARAEAAGEVELTIKPKGKAKRKLVHTGKAKVTVEVTYTPDGGEPETQIATLKLIERD